MATGKTTVGRLVAAARGGRFVDLDDVIAMREGAPAGELVARDEAKFRVAEAAALDAVIAEAAADPALVVATGGGAAAHGDNLDKMRGAGLVVALTAGLEVSRRRAAGGPRRPLLEDNDDGRAAALLARRAPAYRRAHAAVATDDDDVHGVATRVAQVAAAAERLGPHLRDATLLALGERSYPVVVQDGELDGDLVARHLPAKTTRVAIVTDENVAPRWAEPVTAALRDAGLDPVVFTVAAGEASKTLATFTDLCRQLVDAGLDRRSAIVALGGGVVGDLAGFVAASLFRGIPIIQLPTTLVAMVDSAIGGKTGVDLDTDLGAGKNLVGAFWQPRAVVACLPWLDTLPEREWRAGFGELLKYGLLDGPELWEAVLRLAGAPRPLAQDERRTPLALSEARSAESKGGEVIRRCAAYKAWIVSRDERETRGERALLNLGHTVGHAIEAAAGWERLHGECVALGLVAAARVSAALVGAPADLEDRVAAAVASAGLDADLDPWLRDEVLGAISVDKKRAGSRLGFVTMEEVGRCAVVDVEVAELRRILRRRETG